MQKYIDSHCHLPDTEPFETVFVHANTLGVTGCVVNAVSQSDWTKIANVANNTNIVGCVGIHPWYVESVTHGWDNDVAAILRDNPSLLVGEIGLDKMYDNFATQEKIFIRCLEMAIKYRRTINLHCVHAWDEILKILKTYKSDLPKIVAHSFDGTQNVIDSGIGFYFSYSPNVANTKFKRVAESVSRVPKNKILVESDSDDLLGTIKAADGVCDIRQDVSNNDLFNNAMGVFFNG